MVLKHLTDRMRGYKEKQLNLSEFINHNKLDMILNNNFDLCEFELYNIDELLEREKDYILENIDDYTDELQIIDLEDEDALMDEVFELALDNVYGEQVYQFFIVSEYDVNNYWDKYTTYPIYYNIDLDLFLIGITHYGMSWKYFNTSFKVKEYFMD